MTPREKLEALAECRAVLEHDPEYGRAANPALWARLDAQVDAAAAELVSEAFMKSGDKWLDAREAAADALNAIRVNGGMEPIIPESDGIFWPMAIWPSSDQWEEPITIPESRVWEEM